jgi:acyl-CoA reductase-like NAD-dependent aldehyde dehydrogenase
MNPAITTAPTSSDGLTRLRWLFDTQRAAVSQCSIPPLAQRLRMLKALQKALLEQREALAEAIDADFGGRSKTETLFVEVYGLIDEIRHTVRALPRWVRPRRVPANPETWPGRASLHYQPLGIIGVIGAFNYPLYLALSPAIGAIAAGNRVMIKPSEQAPRTAALLENMIGHLFTPDQVGVVTGGPELSRAFGELDFDHIVFTGSARVGRQVLVQAAEKLVPVTLELGGKSPAIIAPGCDLADAAARIMYAKLLNAGQTCVAPDIAWVPQKEVAAFIEAAYQAASRFLPNLVANPNYTRIISSPAYERLQHWIDEAQARGAQVRTVNPAGETCNSDNGVFPPTLVSDCPPDCALRQQEIFGPVLPVIGYSDLEAVVDITNAGPPPLAAYLFDRDRQRADHIVERLKCGGITVNGCLYHVGQHQLPLGGVGESGMGAYHGYHGFQTFSCRKSVFHASRLVPDHWMHPPYGARMEWLLGWLLHRRPVRESSAAKKPR